MLLPFFYMLRDGGMKTSITEWLALLEAMKKGLAGQSVDNFYYLARTTLVICSIGLNIERAPRKTTQVASAMTPIKMSNNKAAAR